MYTAYLDELWALKLLVPRKQLLRADHSLHSKECPPTKLYSSSIENVFDSSLVLPGYYAVCCKNSHLLSLLGGRSKCQQCSGLSASTGLPSPLMTKLWQRPSTVKTVRFTPFNLQSEHVFQDVCERPLHWGLIAQCQLHLWLFVQRPRIALLGRPMTRTTSRVRSRRPLPGLCCWLR